MKFIGTKLFSNPLSTKRQHHVSVRHIHFQIKTVRTQ